MTDLKAIICGKLFDSVKGSMEHERILFVDGEVIVGNESYSLNKIPSDAEIIDAKNSVSIEDNVKIGWGCAIISNSTVDGKKGPIILKEGCKVGAHSVIFPNIIVGKNAIIGANSLVNCNIPENEVWAGSPAKKIR